MMRASDDYMFFRHEEHQNININGELRKKLLELRIIEAVVYLVLFVLPLAFETCFKCQKFGTYLTVFYAGIPIVIYGPSCYWVWRTASKYAQFGVMKRDQYHWKAEKTLILYIYIQFLPPRSGRVLRSAKIVWCAFGAF